MTKVTLESLVRAEVTRLAQDAVAYDLNKIAELFERVLDRLEALEAKP